MPELPEVETVRRGLEPVMDGARFRKVELRRRDLRWPLPKDFAARLQGKTVTGLGRRAKYLLADLSSGDVLLMHLGMSGSFHVFREAGSKKLARYYHEREQQAAHDHVVFHMSSGAIVTFNDPRRFGSMKIVARDRLDDEPLLSRLGPEPLGNAFDAAMLAAACAGKKTSLKAALLDQRVVAGIGNIYACEALHRALLSPKRLASTIASKSGAPTNAPNGWSTASRRCSTTQSKRAAHRCAIINAPTAISACSNIISESMTAKGCAVSRQAVQGRSSASFRMGARRFIARYARSEFLPLPARGESSSVGERFFMAYENIIVETRGKVGLIRLNRPQALNALNRALVHDLTRALDAFEADANIGCILITGSDKAFAAGADIKEMADKTFDQAYLGDFAANWDRAATVRKPVIAAVAGFALGGGCELAMQCDLIIAADNAKFGQPEIKLGVIPGIGGTQRFTRAVGKAKAMDIMLTGRMMDVEEAERSGLVARIVPLASLVEEAVKVAETIASMSLPSVLAAKEAVNRAFETSLAEGVRFERRVFHSLFATADQKEGMAAFIAKRPPRFENK